MKNSQKHKILKRIELKCLEMKEMMYQDELVFSLNITQYNIVNYSEKDYLILKSEKTSKIDRTYKQLSFEQIETRVSMFRDMLLLKEDIQEDILKLLRVFFSIYSYNINWIYLNILIIFSIVF